MARSYVPYTGDLTTYGSGPEHLFFQDAVAPSPIALGEPPPAAPTTTPSGGTTGTASDPNINPQQNPAEGNEANAEHGQVNGGVGAAGTANAAGAGGGASGNSSTSGGTVSSYSDKDMAAINAAIEKDNGSVNPGGIMGSGVMPSAIAGTVGGLLGSSVGSLAGPAGSLVGGLGGKAGATALAKSAGLDDNMGPSRSFGVVNTNTNPAVSPALTAALMGSKPSSMPTSLPAITQTLPPTVMAYPVSVVDPTNTGALQDFSFDFADTGGMASPGGPSVGGFAGSVGDITGGSTGFSGIDTNNTGLDSNGGGGAGAGDGGGGGGGANEGGGESENGGNAEHGGNNANGGMAGFSIGGMPDKYDSLISAAASKYRIDPDLLGKLLWQEARGNPNAVSPAGAQGIAQFMPATAQQRGINPLNPDEAIPGAAGYLRENIDRFGGNVPMGVAAYNAGPGRMAQVQAGKASLPDETAKYVNIITGAPLPGQPGEPSMIGNNMLSQPQQPPLMAQDPATNQRLSFGDMTKGLQPAAAAPVKDPNANNPGGMTNGQMRMLSMAQQLWKGGSFADLKYANGGLAGGRGFLNDAGPGRADTIKTKVPAGTYIMPADVVSGLGQGNSLAGAKVLDRFASSAPKAAPDQSGNIPVMLSGGEHRLPPHVVSGIGGGSLDAGAAHLDNLVHGVRKTVINHLSNLPGPQR